MANVPQIAQIRSNLGLAKLNYEYMHGVISTVAFPQHNATEQLILDFMGYYRQKTQAYY